MSFGLLALIVGAGLAGPLLAIGRQAWVPVVVGELAAGVVIGRTGAGWLDATEPTVSFLADVGFGMLMFAAGMHVPVRTPGISSGLRRGALTALVVAALAVPAGLGIAAAVGGGDGPVYALLLASGSAAIVLPALQESGLIADARALTVMSQVALADVAAIVALPLMLQPSQAGRAAVGGLTVAAVGVVAFVVARAASGHEIVHRVRHASKQRRWALDLRLALLLLFGLAWVAQRTGAGILVAGFTVGLLVAAIGGPKRLSKQVIGIAAGFFVPLFFVVLGARLDLRALVDHPSFLTLAVLLVALNVVVHLAGALIARQSVPAGLIATAQLGVPAAVVTVGFKEGAIAPAQGAAIIVAALVSIGISSGGVALLGRDRAGISSAPGPTGPHGLYGPADPPDR